MTENDKQVVARITAEKAASCTTKALARIRDITPSATTWDSFFLQAVLTELRTVYFQGRVDAMTEIPTGDRSDPLP